LVEGDLVLGTVPILYRSESFVAVDKPSGLLSVPSRLGAADLRQVLGIELEKQLKTRLWPIHRLDEEVSGAILFALTPMSHKTANSWFEHRLVAKSYEAFSIGDGAIGQGESFTWTCKLARGKKRAYIQEAIGKDSLTEGRLIGRDGPYFLWRLHPKTGRSHQLRFEMARHLVPIVGDVLYGGSPWHQEGIALRSVQLDFSQIPQGSRLGLPEQIDAPSLRDL
jgi:tRNA pseudouridine32 synthase/23S rRNA pseudouridine746 synthase